MIDRNVLKALALATTCLVPLTVYAADDGSGFDLDSVPPVAQQEQQQPASQYNNEVVVGIKGVMGTHANQGGRYSGQTTTGLDETLDFHLHDKAEWKADDTWYYDATGSNIVFQDNNRLTGIFHDNAYTSKTANNLANDGTITIKLGQQGTWGVTGYYDAISYTGNVIDSIYTVNGTTGVLNGGLQPWGGATASTEGPTIKSSTAAPSGGHTPQAIASLVNAETPFQTGTRRDIAGGDIKYILGNWTFTTTGKHEHKEGTLEETLNSGYTGTAFTLPISYDTDRYDVSAAYNTRDMQAVIQNTYSHFTDNNNFVTMPFPFSNATAPFQSTAAYSTPPSNDADYMTVMLASNALPSSRVNLNARYGLEMQDDAFAPNTADPNPTAAMSNAFNTGPGTGQTSLGAVAQVYQLNATATSHPFANADARLFYGVDGRAVHQNVTQVAGANSQTSMDTAAPVNMIARAQEWLKQKFGGEVGYKILPEYNTKLTVGYKRDEVDRSFAQVGHSYTNTESIGVHSDLNGPETTGSLTYEHGDRSGSINYANPWLAYGVNASNVYEMYYSAAYYQAPMVSDSIKLRADYAPTNDFSSGFSVRFKNDNYDYSANPTGTGYATLTGYGQGIKNDYNLTVGPDINYRPVEGVNTHFYYSYEQIFYNNDGNGGCALTTSSSATCGTSNPGSFENQYTSSVNNVGIDGDWQVNSKVKLGANYNFAYGAVGFGEYNGVYIGTPTKYYQNVSNYPDIHSVMHSLQLKASYDVMPDVEVVSQYAFTMFRNNDWNNYASPVQQAGTAAVSYLTPGYGTPNYSVSTIMVGLKIKF